MELRTKTTTIREKEYTFQEIPARQFLKMKQRCTDKNGQPIQEAFYSEILEHIVVSPKVKIDDFGFSELDELASAAMEFQIE